MHFENGDRGDEDIDPVNTVIVDVGGPGVAAAPPIQPDGCGGGGGNKGTGSGLTKGTGSGLTK